MITERLGISGANYFNFLMNVLEAISYTAKTTLTDITTNTKTRLWAVLQVVLGCRMSLRNDYLR